MKRHETTIFLIVFHLSLSLSLSLFCSLPLHRYKAFMRVDFLKKGILNGLLNEDDSFLRVCLDTLRTQHKLLSFISPPLAGAVVFHRPERVVCL